MRNVWGARRSFSILMSIVCLPGLSGIAQAAEIFTLTSPAFEDNGRMAFKYGGISPSNPNCKGQNISPPLAWSHAPAGTKSFVLFMWDPDGRFGTGVSHWVAYGIPGDVTSLAEGEASQPSPRITGGKNASGTSVYFGPCPAPATGSHHYVTSIVATDIPPGELAANLTREEVLTAIQGRGKAVTTIVGRMPFPD